MSMFHLRDSLSESGFSNRVESVFSALGSGSVKTPEKEPVTDGRRHGGSQPNFDQDQYNRSIKPRETNAKRRKFDSDFDFKHPAEFLRDDSRNSRRESRGGERAAGDGSSEDRRSGRGRRDFGGTGGRGSGRGRGGGFTPDYKKNPDKWTKYTLSDVDNMTDRSNTAAAFQFLKSIKSSEKKGDTDSADMETNEKPVFKKPTKKVKSDINREDIEEGASGGQEEKEGNEKARFVGGKQVMPECVVGVKVKEKKVKERSKMKDKLVLSHLEDEEEEES